MRALRKRILSNFKILEPLFDTKHETARRVRGRIEWVLDYATAAGFRHGDKPPDLRRLTAGGRGRHHDRGVGF